MTPPEDGALVALLIDRSAIAVPLCVDLDGTLVCTDTLWEGLVLLLRTRPWVLLLALVWVFRGRAHFKRRVSESVAIDVQSLPYHQPLLVGLRAAREAGRTLVLATAADIQVARRVASHVGLFDEVCASERGQNLKADHKAVHLVARFGARGFDYVGDSRADLSVFPSARRGILVSTTRGIARAARLQGNVEVVSYRPNVLRAVLKQMRLHQWAKNVLVVVPAVLAPIPTLDHLLHGVVAALAFSLCASAGYVFNDLLDLEADRVHGSKRRRPLASGALPVAWGPPLFVALLVASCVLSLTLLNMGFTVMLGIYFVATLTYSFYLKRFTLLDVLVLAWLYTHRILSGSLATSVPTSAWLLAFSMFLFLSLAFVKRYVELSALPDDKVIKHRDYKRADIPMVASMGTASGYIAVLVFALYVDQGARSTIYAQPILLWFSVPVLLYWVSRVWIIAGRGRLQDDPVKFALRDGVSIACGALVVAIAWLARHPPSWLHFAQ